MRRPGTGPALAGVGIATAALFFLGLVFDLHALRLAVKPFPALALAAAPGLAGAVAFGASDTLLAFDRFDGPVPGAIWPVMVLYWLGQNGIAASAVVACGMLPGQVRTR